MEHDMEWEGKYRSELLMVCHMDAKAMHDAGVISDTEMREFDRDCLVSKKNSESTTTPKQNLAPVYANSQESV